MPDTVDNPFEPLPTPQATSTRDIARAAARAALADDQLPTPSESLGEETELILNEPASQFDTIVRAADKTGVVKVGGEETEEDGTPVPSVEEVAQEFEEVWTEDDFSALTKRGIDIPVDITQIPEEYRPHIGRMATMVEEVYGDLEQVAERASLAEQRLASFADRMRTPEGQERVLMTLALGNPDGFAKVMKTYERMQEDQQYADVMRRSLEADIKLEQAEMQQRAQINSRTQTYAQQVERRTTGLAQRLGVDAELAKQMVVSRILANKETTGKADIKLSEVDAVIKDLAVKTGAKPRPRPHKDPATVIKETAAPTKPVADAGKTPPPAAQEEGGFRTRPGLNPDSERFNLQSAIRGAVRQSTQRVKQAGL